MSLTIQAAHRRQTPTWSSRATLRHYARAELGKDLLVVAATIAGCHLAAAFPSNAFLLLLTGVTASIWFHRKLRALPLSIGTIVIVALVAPPSATPLIVRATTNTSHMVAFVVVLFIGATTEALNRARRAAELQSVGLTRLNVKLESHMEEVQTLSDHLEQANEGLSIALSAAERTASRASALQDVTAALSVAATVPDVAEAVLARGLRAVGAVRGCLVLVGEAKAASVVRAVGYSHGEESLLNWTLLAGDGPLADAMHRNCEVWLDTPTGCDACLNRTIRTRLALPLTHGNDVVGALGFDFVEDGIKDDADALFIGLLCQATADAVRRARRYDEAHEARRGAELMSRVREEVLGVVAHDLRNPLNLVASSAQLLMEPELDRARRDVIYAIAMRAVHRMNKMVDDLLNVVRMESGALPLDVKPCDANRIVGDAVDALRPIAAERGIVLEVQTTEESVSMTADEERLVQLLDNLVGNALKFTPRGGRVTVTAGSSRGELTVAVSDTGPGISAEHRARLFERFWQARGADRRGVGLGLAIARGIAEAHGGRLSVESTLGEGSVFRFSIPLQPRAPVDNGQGPSSSDLADFALPTTGERARPVGAANQ